MYYPASGGTIPTVLPIQLVLPNPAISLLFKASNIQRLNAFWCYLIRTDSSSLYDPRTIQYHPSRIVANCQLNLASAMIQSIGMNQNGRAIDCTDEIGCQDHSPWCFSDTGAFYFFLLESTPPHLHEPETESNPELGCGT